LRSGVPIEGEKVTRFVPSAASRPDPDRLGDVAVEEGDTVDGLRVLRVMSEHEQRPPPGRRSLSLGPR
jgi:hypothetical protein